MRAVFFPTYQRRYGPATRRRASCPLCGERVELLLTPRTSRVFISTLIPLGRYEECIADCPACRQQFLIDARLERALIPDRRSRLLSGMAWVLFFVPVLGLVLMLLVLRSTPNTSNDRRQWAKIGLVPATLTTLMLLFTLALEFF